MDTTPPAALDIAIILANQDQIIANLRDRLASLEQQLNALAKIVITDPHSLLRRVGKLDHHEGKDDPHWHNPLLRGTDVDHSSPQYQGEIHQEFPPIVTPGGTG